MLLQVDIPNVHIFSHLNMGGVKLFPFLKSSQEVCHFNIFSLLSSNHNFLEIEYQEFPSLKQFRGSGLRKI